jgi:hypothetical protein
MRNVLTTTSLGILALVSFSCGAEPDERGLGEVCIADRQCTDGLTCIEIEPDAGSKQCVSSCDDTQSCRERFGQSTRCYIGRCVRTCDSPCPTSTACTLIGVCIGY